MTVLNPRAHLKAVTARAQSLLANDLEALAEDKACAIPGGVTRPAIEVVVECAALNGAIATLLTTGEMNRPDPEQRKAFFASFTTREQAKAFLEKQTQQLLATLDGLDENTLGDIIKGPLGPMTRFAIAEIPYMHMMYHDGQLNYLQALHGDSEMHW